MKQKILVYLDFDILVRHFILSGTFAALERDYDLHYIFHRDSTDPKRKMHVDVDLLGLRNYEWCEVTRQRMGSWFKLFAVTLLHNQMGRANFWPLRQRLASIMTGGNWRTWIFAVFALPGIYPIYRRRYLAHQGTDPVIREQIEQHQPAIILMPSLLTGYFINDVIIIAKEQGIPVVAMMNSWDNPSQKAVVTAQPDKLIVWGDQTRAHAIEYMAMPPEDVLAFGAAQFQVYRKTVTETDSELRAEFGVPEGRPVVLYGGVSKSVNETRHLKMLDDAIEAGNIEPCHIVYRPHPWRECLVEGEDDFFALALKNVTMDPSMVEYYRHIAETPDPALFMADYDKTRRLMALITCAISPLSTLMLEVIMHGKQVMMFFPRIDMETKYGPFNRISLRLAHFKGFFDSDGVTQCMEQAELPEAVNTMLRQADDPKIRRRLLEHASHYVDMSEPSYGERLHDLIDELTGHRPDSSE
jgi:hypothetical protein